MFRPPDYICLDIFDNSKEYYNDSLKSSVRYLMDSVENYKPIVSDHYNQSISTTKELLKGVVEYE